MYYKAVDQCFLVFIHILVNIRIKKYVDRANSDNVFVIVCCLDKYKTQRMCY